MLVPQETTIATNQMSSTNNQETCSICEKKLRIHDGATLCFICEDDLKSVPKDYPEDAARAQALGDYAFHALILRINANNCREAVDDATVVAEKLDCYKESIRLDEVATRILKTHFYSDFKPWWFYRWDHWNQPSYLQNAPKTTKDD